MSTEYVGSGQVQGNGRIQDSTEKGIIRASTGKVGSERVPGR